MTTEVPDAGREQVSPVGEAATATTPSLIVQSAADDYPHPAVNEYLHMSAARGH